MVTAAWIVNQAIGFGALGYPLNANTILWGLAIGLAALIATATSVLVLRALPRTGSPAVLSLALVAAYAAYEVVAVRVHALFGRGWCIHLGGLRPSRRSEPPVVDRAGGGVRSVSPTHVQSPASNTVLKCRST